MSVSAGPAGGGPRRIRSILFAPAIRPDVLAKLNRSGPDSVAVDLEDAVPPASKAEARAHAAEATRRLASEAGALVFVRVNALPTEWYAGDVASLDAAVAGVVLPKAEQAADVERLRADLAARGLAPLLCAGLETAAGVAHAQDIARVADLVYFGAEDFIADMGGRRTPESTEVLFARSAVALAARLASVPAIDQVVTDFRDEDGFRRDAAVGRAIGYQGKLCIHPAQVALAHEAFSATVDELDRARRLLATYEAAIERGTAACEFEGQMVDEPVARQARALLASAGEG